jgi:hypothetical protein
MRRCRFALVTVAIATLAACATLPEDQPVLEKLDADTGVTIARIGKPIELYREFAPNGHTDRFAYIAPFETNLMGQRATFLWVAVPVDPALKDSPPGVDVNGTALALGAPGQSADFAGLTKSPYKIPTPWSVLYYFKADADVIAKLGESQRLVVRMPEASKTGTIEARFAFEVAADTRLKDFAARP